jgi:colanic acid/amylovoran biosynthesis glycosyltransferase
MKVAFFLGTFPTLSETFILGQITGLLDRGVEVDIYASPPPQGIPVHPEVARAGLLNRTYYRPARRQSRWSGKLLTCSLLARLVATDPATAARYAGLRGSTSHGPGLSFLYDMHPRARRFEYDIIHAHFGPLGRRAIALRDLGLLSGKVVTSFHAYDITSYVRTAGLNVYRHLFASGDLFLPISSHAEEILLRLGCPKDRTKIHRMGVDCEALRFEPPVLTGDRPTRLLAIGRLVEKKGFDVLLDALAVARCRNRVKLTVIGDGPLSGYLSDRVQALRLGDSVKLAGWQDQLAVHRALVHCDVLIAPSVTALSGDEEGIPVAIMEAMAVGRPVISTWHAGIPELVEDGVSGRLVGERDVTELSAAIDAMHEGRERWTEMGAAGRAIIEKGFNLAVLNDGLVRLYAALSG